MRNLHLQKKQLLPEEDKKSVSGGCPRALGFAGAVKFRLRLL